MVFGPVLGVLVGHLPLIGEICLVSYKNPSDELTAIDNRVVIVPVTDAL